MATNSLHAAMTDVAFAGLAEHAAMLDRGQISSRELTDLFLDRIERHDPALNAFRVVFDELARTEAAQADARRRSGDRRPLLGIPLAIKDDTDIQGQVTAFGSSAADGPAKADSEVVRRLRGAGAVFLGQTHVPELMIVPFTESPTFGITRNPWDLQRTPGGSSGGSAAAVAAGLCSAALGSDGGGSIRIPAACCGLFGLKPQRGRVPTAPSVEPWHGLSTWGAITRRVADSARFYDAIRDGGESFADAAARGLGGGFSLRIAVSRKVPPGVLARPDAEQLGALDGTAELLRSLGHEVVERELDYGNFWINFATRYLRGVRDEAMRVPYPERLSRRTRGYMRIGSLIPDAALARAREQEAADRDRINHVFAEGFDVVMTPMFTRRPPKVMYHDGRSAFWTVNSNARWIPYPEAFNHIGQPAASVPAGFTGDGFPLAVQLAGPPDGEGVLLSLAAQLERERDWPAHRPPATP
jgi:amidase